MTLFDPNPDLRWLFCMTHPDDEIAIGAWIRRLTQAGCAVYISWTHSNPVREQEGRDAAAFLGVPASNLHFFGATDGNVVEEISTLVPRFRAFIEESRPDRIVVGAFEQGHIDHDSTNYIVNRSFSGSILEVPFYHAYCTPLMKFNRFAESGGEEILQLDDADQRTKIELSKLYPSQNIRSLLVLYEAANAIMMNRERLYMTERMRLQRHRDFLTPNLPSSLVERVVKTHQWRRWTAHIRMLESQTATAANARKI